MGEGEAAGGLDANDGQVASILPLADYGMANFEGVNVTDHGNQSGGFISSAWH